jgi:hypothetical protein
MMPRIWLLLLALLAFAVPADARFGPLNLVGGVPVSGGGQTIASVGPSTGSYTTGASSGTVVATLAAVMSPSSPAFSGTYAASTSASICNGTNGANNSDFSVNASTGAVSLAITGPGGTQLACFIAQQGGISNSPVGVAMTITGSSQTISFLQLSNTTYTPNSANAVVGNVSVVMSPTSPASTAAITVSGANSGGFHVTGAGCANISAGTCTLETNTSGTTGVGPYSDTTLVATQAGISNSPQSYTPPSLTGSGSYVFAANTITVSNQSGAAANGSQTVYPYQFGRAFIDGVYNPSGAINPASQCPEITAYLSAGTGTLAGAVSNSTSGTLSSSFTSGTYTVTDSDTTDGGLRQLTLNTTTAVVSGTSLTFSTAQTLAAGDVLNFYPTSGTVLSSQMDGKNYYPDGDVEFAVMSVLIPTSFLPTSGADSMLAITPASGACSNTPLTSAQMLNTSNFPFDAQIVIGTAAKLYGGNVPSYNYASSLVPAYQGITNGGFDIAVNGTPYAITGINFATPNHAQLGVQTNAGSANLTLSAVPSFTTNGALNAAVITDITNPAAITAGTTVTCGAPYNQTANCVMSANAAQNILTTDTLGFSVTDFSYPAGQIQQIVQAAANAAMGSAAVYVSIPEGCCLQLINASITTTAVGAGASITVASPPSSGTDLSMLLGLNAAAVSGYGGSVSTPLAHTTSARTMLTAANSGPGCTNGPVTSLCTYWTSGSVATSILLADATGGYDFGSGDGHTPFRPKFYATFWPATGQVWVRPIGQNAQTTYSEDIPFDMYMCTGYPSCVQGTQGYPASGYYDMTGDTGIEDWAWSTFDWPLWIGGVPTPEINIDNNISYWDQTHILPHYDPSLVMNESDLDTYYEYYYSTGGGAPGIEGFTYDIFSTNMRWPTYMENYGGQAYIGLNPTWDTFWLYSPNWKMRQMSVATTNLAGVYPLAAEESRTGFRLSRADTSGSSTGLGYPVSITDNSCNIDDSAGSPANCFPTGPNDGPYKSSVALTHEPEPFFLPYYLTGDEWYLNMKQEWSSVNAMSSVTRGPSSDYEYILDRGNAAARGEAWPTRDLINGAFITPDSSPEKSYLTYIVNDVLASDEGGLNITDPVYSSGSTGNQNAYNYGATRRDSAACLNQTSPPSTDCGGTPVTVPLGFWSGAAQNTPNADQSAPYVGGFCCGEMGFTTNTGIYGFTDPWMEWYLSGVIGRATELGYHALPLLESQTAILQDINGQTTTAAKVLVASYEFPANQVNGGWIQSSINAVVANNLPWKVVQDAVGTLTGYLEDTSTTAETLTLSGAITGQTTATVATGSTLSGTFNVTDSLGQLSGSPTITVTNGDTSTTVSFSSAQTLSNGDVFTLYESLLHITSIPSGEPVNWLDLIDCSGCTEEAIQDFGGGGGVGAYQVNIPQVKGSSGSPVAMTATPNYGASSNQYGIPGWLGSLYPGGYEAYANLGLAAMVDNGIAGAASAWSWLDTNSYVPIGADAGGTGDTWTRCTYLANCGYEDGYWGPLWAIVPYPSNDPVRLPAQPTATPP